MMLYAEKVVFLYYFIRPNIKSSLKINFSTGNVIALWKKRCGKDQEQLIM